jgi:hypothetical protein
VSAHFHFFPTLHYLHYHNVHSKPTRHLLSPIMPSINFVIFVIFVTLACFGIVYTNLGLSWIMRQEASRVIMDEISFPEPIEFALGPQDDNNGTPRPSSSSGRTPSSLDITESMTPSTSDSVLPSIPTAISGSLGIDDRV